jgi:hypothetical protein
MTPAEIRAIVQALPITAAQLDAVMGAGIGSVSRWQTGAVTPTAPVLRLLRAYADGHRPADWPKAASDDAPRAYTEHEVRDLILDAIRTTAAYWASLPDVDSMGQPLTIQGRCNGVAFSILTMLDGCTDLPAMTLTMCPASEDAEFLRGEGENWFQPGMEICTMMHEHFYRKEPSHDHH